MGWYIVAQRSPDWSAKKGWTIFKKGPGFGRLAPSHWVARWVDNKKNTVVLEKVGHPRSHPVQFLFVNFSGGLGGGKNTSQTQKLGVAGGNKTKMGGGGGGPVNSKRTPVREGCIIESLLLYQMLCTNLTPKTPVVVLLDERE